MRLASAREKVPNRVVQVVAAVRKRIPAGAPAWRGTPLAG
jgi:hypothetical protein